MSKTKLPIDYYNGSDAPNFAVPPPAPAAPTTRAPSLLRLRVPSEHTELHMGAGKTPGVRMVTDNHAHLTARSPLTTISLGSPGGDGIAKGDPGGVNVYTAGEKRETIARATVEQYNDTKGEYVQGAWGVKCDGSKTEYIQGVWNRTCANAMTETVAGTVTQMFGSEHNLSVGGAADYHYGSHKTETIEGHLEIHTKQNKNETTDGDKKHIQKGQLWNLTYGLAFDFFLGIKNSIYIIDVNTFTYGLNASVNLGVKFETTLASVAATGLKVNRDQVKIEYVGFRNQQGQIINQDSKVQLNNAETNLFRSIYHIIK